MRKVGVITKALAGAALLIAVTDEVSAGFRNNYAEWRSMEPVIRAAYVQGMFDLDTGSSTVGEPDWRTARRTGLWNCATDLKLTAEMFAEAVTRHYETYVDDWSFPPAVVFDQVLRNICLRHINQERGKKGLEPWKPFSGSISSSL